MGETASGSLYLDEDGRIVLRRLRQCNGCGEEFIASKRGLHGGRFQVKCETCRMGPPEVWELVCAICDQGFRMPARRGRPPACCSTACSIENRRRLARARWARRPARDQSGGKARKSGTARP